MYCFSPDNIIFCIANYIYSIFCHLYKQSVVSGTLWRIPDPNSFLSVSNTHNLRFEDWLNNTEKHTSEELLIFLKAWTCKKCILKVTNRTSKKALWKPSYCVNNGKELFLFEERYFGTYFAFCSWESSAFTKSKSWRCTRFCRCCCRSQSNWALAVCRRCLSHSASLWRSCSLTRYRSEKNASFSLSKMKLYI